MNTSRSITEDNDIAVKVGRISYINVDPVYYQFDHESIPDGMQVISRPPAVLNRMLSSEELDISSVSSSAFARYSDQWMILPDLSIACFGKVLSVLLVSRHPFEALDGKTVFLTEDSATAVDLIKLICSLKGVVPVFQTRRVKAPDDLTENATAGLVIGDAALKHHWEDHFSHVFDLCEIWNEMTGLPFVFALWAVRKSYAEKFPDRVLNVLERLKISKELGLQHLEGIVHLAAQKIGIDIDLSRKYYKSMYYSMSKPEVQCLREFFNRLYDNQIIDKKPDLKFFNPIESYQAMCC